MAEDPFGAGPDGPPPLDGLEFMLAAMADPGMACDPDEFPLLQWFARIPDGGMSAEVWGLRAEASPDASVAAPPVYDGLLIKCRGDPDA